MSSVVIEPATGAINGTNRVFSLSSYYAPGSTRVFLNGRVLRGPWDNGWIELGAKKIELKEPPLPGDDIQVYYQPV